MQATLGGGAAGAKVDHLKQETIHTPVLCGSLGSQTYWSFVMLVLVFLHHPRRRCPSIGRSIPWLAPMLGLIIAGLGCEGSAIKWLALVFASSKCAYERSHKGINAFFVSIFRWNFIIYPWTQALHSHCPRRIQPHLSNILSFRFGAC